MNNNRNLVAALSSLLLVLVGCSDVSESPQVIQQSVASTPGTFDRTVLPVPDPVFPTPSWTWWSGASSESSLPATISWTRQRWRIHCSGAHSRTVRILWQLPAREGTLSRSPQALLASRRMISLASRLRGGRNRFQAGIAWVRRRKIA